MMQPNADQVRVACLTVGQIYAQFADSHIIRSISVVTASASMQTFVDVLYLRLLLLILSQFLAAPGGRRLIALQEIEEQTEVVFIDPKRASIEQTIAVVFPGTVNHSVYLQSTQPIATSVSVIGSLYSPVEAQLPTFDYEAVVSHTNSSWTVVLQVDWQQQAVLCLVGVGQRPLVEFAHLPLPQAVFIAIAHRIGGAYLPEDFWSRSAGSSQPVTDLVQMFHSLYSTVHPRRAVTSLYKAEWAINESPKFRRLLSLPGQNPTESPRHIAIFQIEPLAKYDAAFTVVPGNGPAEAGKVSLSGG